MPARVVRLGISGIQRILNVMEPSSAGAGAVVDETDTDTLLRAIEEAARLLPAQGPITVFIHHNTLHAFERLPFESAMTEAARVYGCQPYLSEDQYRAELERGRIRGADLRSVLLEDLGERGEEAILPQVSRLEIRLAMLQHAVWAGRAPELRWFVAETSALRRMRPGVSAATRRMMISETRRWVLRDLRGSGASRRFPGWASELLAGHDTTELENSDGTRWEALTLEALWRACCEGVEGVSAPEGEVRAAIRHQELLQQVTGLNADEPVHDLLIRFCAAYLDQGVSNWSLPARELGFLRSFCNLYGRAGGPPDRVWRGLRAAVSEVDDSGREAIESVRASLDALGVAPGEWAGYLRSTILALRGWGGIIREVERRGDRVPCPIPEGTLVGFLAVRLLLDRVALRNLAGEAFGFQGPLSELRAQLESMLPSRPPLTLEQRAFPIYQLAQVLGWSAPELCALSAESWESLVREAEGFQELERRRVFHLAYERRFYEQALDAMALHQPVWKQKGERARFQVVTCLDDREESFRRHLEEVAPDCQTYGAAGFYGVAMYYRGAAEATFTPLCPIVIQPNHWVVEEVDQAHSEAHRWRSRVRKAIGGAAHRVHVWTRSIAAGAFLSAGLGVLASIPLVVRILFPRLAERVRHQASGYVRSPRATHLVIERASDAAGSEPGHPGYSVEEMAEIAEKLLREIGIINGFARLIVILGHGSNSLNNPHKSAYDCGACGGSPGAPNGRAIAAMLNHPSVRERLRARGLEIPSESWFLGGFHNTCDDVVTLSDLNQLPASHQREVGRLRADLDEACGRNAHERCRRFQLAPLDMNEEEARVHVAGRSADLAQTRPELGHATNAICIVGRRERTRGLFLDRRAFLTSYDPSQDDAKGSILTGILAAAVPVCAGITLEYYFSKVDPQGFGAGTKLPHNITSLLGVMDGAASDLRTGLPWQMVEIHEPMRLLVVIETTSAIMESIIESHPAVKRTIVNEWIIMAIMDPETGRIQCWKKGAWVPYVPRASHLPSAPRSVEWYRGWRDHLEFAEILPTS